MKSQFSVRSLLVIITIAAAFLGGLLTNSTINKRSIPRPPEISDLAIIQLAELPSAPPYRPDAFRSTLGQLISDKQYGTAIVFFGLGHNR